MKRLEDGFDPSQLVGGEFETALFASNLATFQLTGGPLITALAGVTPSVGGEIASSHEDPLWAMTRLLALIGQCVDSASVDLSGRLVVRFGDGSTLGFVPDGSGYESFVVSIDGHEWFA